MGDGQRDRYGKSTSKLKNLVASGFFIRKNKRVHRAGDNLFYKMRYGPSSLQGQLFRFGEGRLRQLDKHSAHFLILFKKTREAHRGRTDGELLGAVNGNHAGPGRTASNPSVALLALRELLAGAFSMGIKIPAGCS